MAGVFISYRRDDAAGFAGRLADALEREFGAAMVFRDQEDIVAGDDFVAALDRALGEFSVMLVVIGPAWLGAMHRGVRRLDDADDFVRREVLHGLASGKAVVPVLVGGAAMPGEKELPPALAALARKQAIGLGDADWAAGVARLIAAIRPFVAPRRARTRRVRLAVGALAATFTLAGAVIGLRLLAPASGGKTPLPDGRWQARIVYDWGAAYDEVFELRSERGEVRGSASFLRVARPISGGRVEGERIRFTTQTREMLAGAPERELRHDYHGRVGDDSLELRLETSGGQSPHAPVDFVARRLR